MYPSFEKRLNPPYWFGIIPEPAVLWGAGAILMGSLAFIEPEASKQFYKVIASIGLGAYTLYIMLNYKDWLLVDTKKLGQKRDRLMIFNKQNKPVISDELTYKTFIGDSVLVNDDGSLSLAFTWEGVDERNSSLEELQHEHDRRVSLLHELSSEAGISIEHHFFRHNDSTLIDQYEKYHDHINKKHKIAPIVQNIKKDLASLYRPLAKSNQVITVLSIAKKNNLDIFSAFIPHLAKLNKNQLSLFEKLQEQFSNIQTEYKDFKLLTKDEFADFIIKTINPYEQPYGIDWRYEIASQFFDKKPIQRKKVLEIDGVFYGTVLIQNYPEMKFRWSRLYSESNCSIHISQYIKPLDTSSAVDKSASKDQDEQRGTQGVKGQYRLGAKLTDSKNFKKYVTQTNNSVHSNFFVITFIGKDENQVENCMTQFSKIINKDRGKARTDLDIQMAMFYTRLPTQGNSSPFMRPQDHADTLALMMPFNTFKTGSKVPESLRLASSASPVLYAPSSLEIPHELTVAQMGGGKDTQYGLTIAETYHDIRYDILELGTSYRGIIEAIGGNYCKAREQVINPLASFEDFKNANKNIGNSDRNLSRDFINMQTMIVQPIFADLNEGQFSTVQEIVINKAIRMLYENPIPNISAPTLPNLLDAMEDVDLEEDRHLEAKEQLGNSLSDFLVTETGKAFKEQDQFVISPIANAIDFDKFEGKLFEYFLTFTCTRLITNAMSTSTRNQILLNEYGVFVERAPKVMRTVTLTLDKMGRKELVGLTRNTQDFEDVTDISSGAVNAIPNKTLLSRADKHKEISEILKIPESILYSWENFKTPEVMDTKGYRQAIVCQRNEWYELHLAFPQLLLDLMNTKGKDKAIREKVFNQVNDPYERIKLFRQLKQAKESQNEIII